MPITDNLYKILQAQATLEHTRASTTDTQSLGQQRALGNMLLQRKLGEQQREEEALRSGRFNNPTTPETGAPGSQVNDTGYPGPVFETVREAQKSLGEVKRQIQVAKELGLNDLFKSSTQQYDNMQSEYRKAQNEATKEAERRNKEAGQMFRSVTNKDEAIAALDYARESLPKRNMQAIESYLGKALPDIDSATPEQITTAFSPIANKVTSGGDQLRFMSTMQGAKIREDELKEKKRHALETERVAAAKQAGATAGEQLTEGGRAILAEMTLKGLTMPGGARNAGTVGIPAINRIAADFEKDGLPASAISEERLKFGGQKAVVRDFSAGPTARNITSINTSLGHLQTLGELGKALDSGDIQIVNKVVSAISNQLGNPELNNAQTAAQAVGEEMMRTFRVVGASVTEAEKWEKKFNQAMQSPEQMAGVIKTGADLLRSRLEAVDDQWKRGMGTDKGFPNIISPKNQDFLGSIGVKYDVNRETGKAQSAAQSAAAPVAATAPVALPPRDQLKAGTTYQTPKGALVWDGKNFVRP